MNDAPKMDDGPRNRYEQDAAMYPHTPQRAAEVIIGILRSIRTLLWFILIWMSVLAVLHSCAN